jgi:hypothetical protein
MDLSEEALVVIEKAAYLGFEVEEVAHLIEVGSNWLELLFANKPDHPAVKAYKKGLYQAEFDLRQAEMNSALSGSQPAQEGMKKHLKKASTKFKEMS